MVLGPRNHRDHCVCIQYRELQAIEGGGGWTDGACQAKNHSTA